MRAAQRQKLRSARRSSPWWGIPSPMASAIQAARRRGPRPPALQHLHPELHGLLGVARDLLQTAHVQAAPSHALGLLHGLPQLPLHVGHRVVGGLVVDEGGVDQDQGHLEVVRQHAIPGQHGLADVVAAEQQVGAGQAPHRCAAREHRADVGTGVGADVP